MKYIVKVIVLVLILQSYMSAQTDGWKVLKYGVFGEFGLDRNVADFKKLQAIPNCCPMFSFGTGTGVTLGGLAEVPVTKKFGLLLRASYTTFSGKMQSTEPTYVIVGSVLQEGSFEHTLHGDFTKIGLDPMVYYAISPKIHITAGARIAYTLYSKYNQKETIIGNLSSFVDSNGADIGRVRNNFSGDIPNAASIAFYGLLGVSYDLPLNKKKSLHLSPSVSYYHDLNSMVTDVDWKVNSIRLGLSLKYSPTTKEQKYQKIRKIDTMYQELNLVVTKYSKGVESIKQEIQSDENSETTVEVSSRTDTIFTQKLNALDGTLKAIGVDSTGKEVASVRISIEEFISNRVQPFLPYIFFDDNSAIIAPKYMTLTPSETQNFTILSLAKSSTLESYYHIMNIVGRRMREFPAAVLTIVGCNSGIGNEHGNKKLSQERAEHVKNYLHNQWGIDEARLIIESRDIPANASTPINDPDKIAENRRVELYSTQFEILEPLDISDTVRVAYPPIARFKLSAKSEAGLQGWNIKALQSNAYHSNFETSGISTIPSMVDWNLNDNQRTIPSIDEQIVVSMQLLDTKGQTKKITTTLPVDYISVSKKRKEGIRDNEIDRYNLILFDFDKSELKEIDKMIIQKIKTRLHATSKITITGYTDRTGDVQRNFKLGQSRATAAKVALGNKNSVTVGVGGITNLYSNDIPEGRLYSRTVEILVETPVE